jgi:hypothetical protein
MIAEGITDAGFPIGQEASLSGHAGRPAVPEGVARIGPGQTRCLDALAEAVARGSQDPRPTDSLTP